MANPEWGTKRICHSCGTKFYDLQRDPIVCPKCQTAYDPEAFLKTRRARAPIAAEKEVAPVGASEIDPDLEAEETELTGDEEASPDIAEGAEEEEEDVIEDASELGEDEDDMAEVIENVDEEEER